MAHISSLNLSNLLFGAEILASESFSPSVGNHLSFLSSSFHKGKRLNTRLVSYKEKNEIGTRWKTQCSNQVELGPPCGNIEALQASTMEEIYDALAKRILIAASEISSSSKYIVGIAGPPGAGKSTVAKSVVQRLNALWFQSNPDAELEAKGMQNDIAVVVPMDGFHLYRSQLDAMKDPEEAHARRGAPWTFDPDGLIKCLQSLRIQGWVHAPSFDHGVGDPKENDIIVTSWHRVVLVEGNYLLLREDKWRTLSDIFDERWFLDIDIETALKRVVNRFVALGRSPEEASARVHYNDRKNAETILKSMGNADLIIKSVDLQRRL